MIGILGGIGSGKSSVVRHVRNRCLQFIDADRIGHDLLHDANIQQQIRQQFGNSVFASPDIIDRKQLAQLVFGDLPQHAQNLDKLNSILHPAIRSVIHQQIDEAAADTEAIILDAALLLEGGWDKVCRHLIFIDTPVAIRQQRVQQNRGWSPHELTKREATQWPIERKRQLADFVVDNSGSLHAAARQMEQIFQSIL